MSGLAEAARTFASAAKVSNPPFETALVFGHTRFRGCGEGLKGPALPSSVRTAANVCSPEGFSMRAAA
jgi:hypothetical protein